MTNSAVSKWFGGDFEKLSPELQELHLHGGTLNGEVNVTYGDGIAGIIGKRLAKKLGIPGSGKHALVVSISHHDKRLHWDRLFNNTTQMKSVFEPIGNKLSGYWVEKTGPLHIKLTVDIKDGGWYWRCLNFTFLGIPLSRKLFPESKAYKRIEDGQYRFYVGFKLWFFGELLSYSGLLRLKKANSV